MRAGDPLPQLSTKGGEKEVSYCAHHKPDDPRLLDVCPTLTLRAIQTSGEYWLTRFVTPVTCGAKLLDLQAEGTKLVNSKEQVGESHFLRNPSD